MPELSSRLSSRATDEVRLKPDRSPCMHLKTNIARSKNAEELLVNPPCRARLPPGASRHPGAAADCPWAALCRCNRLEECAYNLRFEPDPFRVSSSPDSVQSPSLLIRALSPTAAHPSSYFQTPSRTLQPWPPWRIPTRSPSAPTSSNDSPSSA